MNMPVQKSAPLGPGEITPDDAERFAAIFKPIWELDDAPFAPSNGTLQDAAQLGDAGHIHPDVQLVSSGLAMAAAPHAPPPAHVAAPQEDSSVVVDVDPDPTPPPAPPVVQAQPQPRPSKPPSPRKPPAPPPPRPIPVKVDFVPPKKSNTALFVGLGVVGLLGVAGIGIAVMGGSSEKPKPTTTQTTSHEEPRIPPPPPVDDLKPTETKPAETKPAETKPAETKPAVTQARPTPPVDKPVATADKPPPVKPVTNTLPTRPTTTKTGSGIVRDNPF